MTNAEKFKEVFGEKPNKTDCPIYSRGVCASCPFKNKWDCEEAWWNSEYKGDKCES